MLRRVTRSEKRIFGNHPQDKLATLPKAIGADKIQAILTVLVCFAHVGWGMATIVTVHGTFSSGPESGEKWWQKGGPLENELRTLVEGEDGRLDFVPHVWDGLNSENSRRAAGEELFKRLVGFEKNREHYCLIGHSHGGSVILASLLHSTRRRRRLSRLSRWITVGTPFIAFARKPLLFLRLGLLGRAALVAVLTWSALLTLYLFMLSSFWIVVSSSEGLVQQLTELLLIAVIPYLFFHTIVSWIADRRIISSEAVLKTRINDTLLWPRYGILLRLFHLSAFAITAGAFYRIVVFEGSFGINLGIILAAFAIIFLFFHFLLAWVVRVCNRWIEKRQTTASLWPSRWLSLRHPQDEAIEGLSMLPRISFPIFGKEFAVAPFTLASVIAFPVLIVVALFSPNLIEWLNRLVHSDESKPGIGALINVPLSSLYVLGDKYRSVGDLFSLYQVFVPVLGAAMFLLVAIILMTLSRFVAIAVSRLLSSVLDHVAWDQIRISIYGNDTRAENAQSASDTPSSISSQPPLPQSLAEEITDFANTAASGSVAKLRTSINRLAFAEDKRTRSDLIAEYLTWDELIHTAYFKVPLFTKFLAYSIARSEGFRPTATFLADPDYIRLATWYGELTSGVRSETKDGPAQLGLGVKEMEPAVST
jgi:hypothetical protein